MANQFLSKISLGTQAVIVYTGNGSPEGVETAPVGSIYLNATASNAANTLYVKGSGTGNTGWSLLAASTIPAGSDTQIQYNNSGSLAGSASLTWNNSTSVLYANGSVGVGISPTACFHVKAGTATANTAPIKLTSGTNLTVIEAGVFEYDGSALCFSPTSSIRHAVTPVETTPATITSTQNNYNIPNASFIRLSSDADRIISGFANGYAGRRITIRNINASYTFTLMHQSALSSAANRFIFIGGVSKKLFAGQVITLVYDGTTQRWIEEYDYTAANLYRDASFEGNLFTVDNLFSIRSSATSNYAYLLFDFTTIYSGVAIYFPEDALISGSITLLGFDSAAPPAGSTNVAFARSSNPYGAVEWRDITSSDLPANVAYDVGSTTVTVDFGAGGSDASTTVTGLAWVTANTRVVATLTDGPSGRAIDDGLVEGLICGVANIVAGVGFTLYVHSPSGNAIGQFNFYCIGV